MVDKKTAGIAGAVALALAAVYAIARAKGPIAKALGDRTTADITFEAYNQTGPEQIRVNLAFDIVRDDTVITRTTRPEKLNITDSWQTFGPFTLETTWPIGEPGRYSAVVSVDGLGRIYENVYEVK